MTNYKPIPGDENLPGPLTMIGDFNEGDHLLVDSVTTAAAEVWQTSGGHHQYMVIVDMEGRLNKQELRSTQRAGLSVEAAMVLRDNLTHSLRVLAQQVALDDF